MEKAGRPLYLEGDFGRNENARNHADNLSIDLIIISPFRQDTINLVHSSYFRRLEGKTQLFPEYESDLFRDRLTHSIEVSQIARDITNYLNRLPFFESEVASHNDMQISLDLVELAGLAHDIGHPPFGHTGEKALDECMLDWGGFEGNAQTLRTICRLIRRQYPTDVNSSTQLISDKGVDKRIGINITYRAVASILKYDNLIRDVRENGSKLTKGYYWTEKELVERTKKQVLGDYKLEQGEIFRTIECDIMDVADDIAYSTYDIEDAFCAGILHAGDFLYPREEVIDNVSRDIQMRGLRIKEDTIKNYLRSFANGFRQFVTEKTDNGKIIPNDKFNMEQEKLIYEASERLTLDGHIRTQFISWWIKYLISNIELTPHIECPPLTRVSLKKEILEQVETLKSFVYQNVTLSAPLQTINFKGQRIVSEVFKAINSYSDKLLPPYEKKLISAMRQDYNKGKDIGQVRLSYRIISDYIAGMTDQFASSLYEQLMTGAVTRTVNHQLYY